MSLFGYLATTNTAPARTNIQKHLSNGMISCNWSLGLFKDAVFYTSINSIGSNCTKEYLHTQEIWGTGQWSGYTTRTIILRRPTVPIALISVAALRIASSSKPPSKRIGKIFSFTEHRPFVATPLITFRTDHDETVLFLCFPTSCVCTIEQYKIYNSEISVYLFL
jgi:hypothetical protein